jgi:hypothetical protein
MKKLNKLFLLLSFVLVSFNSESQNVNDHGATMPYVRYESETGNFGNGANKLGPTYDMDLLASEATDRQCVSLPSSGSYVEWTAQESADGLTMRFSLPDAPGGGGESGSLALYINGNKVKDILLTSKWAWQYFNIDPSTTGEPSNNPGAGDPRMRFDETHFVLQNQVNPGDVIRIQKDNSDGVDYAVDFIELESVPSPVAQPSGYLNIEDYGAIPDDNSGDAAAIENCIKEASQQNMGVYIPAGSFIMDNNEGSWNGRIKLDQAQLGYSTLNIQGAGMWHTEIYFANASPNGAGFFAHGNNINIADLYLDTETTGRTLGNKGLGGTYGTGSSLTNVWMEHFEVGIWTADFSGNPYIVTDGMIISNCRIRNVYADGVNFSKGSSNNIVENTNFRNCGDDAMATWSSNITAGADQICSNNIFRYCTAENTMRAAGLGIFGGCGHEAHHLLIKDNFAGSGVRVNTQFPAFPFCSSEFTNIHDVTIIGCGTTKNLWTYRFGAIDLELTDPTQGLSYDLHSVNLENIDVVDSQHDAIFVHSYFPSSSSNVFDEVYLTNIDINGTGVARDVNNGPQYFDGSGESGGHGIYAANFATNNDFTGWVEFTGSIKNTVGKDVAYHNCEGDFEIRISSGQSVSDVILSLSGLTMVDGGTFQLSADVEPFNATNKNVTWNSSNSSVASVSSSGLVTASAPGAATITVITEEGGYTDQCNITVNAAVNLIATDPNASENGDIGHFLIEYSGISQDITVGYSVSGTAESGDYTATPSLSGSVTLTPSNPAQTIDIVAIDDSKFEGDETVVLTLQSGAGYQPGGNTNAVITIADNDYPSCEAPAIVYASVSPAISTTIDSEWSLAPAMDVDNVVLGTKSADYAAQWKAMYDEAGLYVLVEVQDAVLQGGTGTEWWNDDAIEIYIDGDNSKNSSYDGLNDFQLAFRWNDPIVKAGDNSVQNTSGVNFEMWASSNGYNCVAYIPWSTIGVSPLAGMQIGFDVAVNDNDGQGRAQITTFSGTEMAFSDPQLFGDVYLTICGGGTTGLLNDVNELSSKTSLILYPVPCHDDLTIEWKSDRSPESIRILDVTGQVVWEEQIPEGTISKKLSVADFEKGVYFVVLKDISGNRVGKMVKQ